MAYQTAPVTAEKIEAFLAAANEMRADYNAKQGFSNRETLVTSKGGRKYLRIESRQPGAEHGSAWAFVEIATGLILKPDGWKTPAKHARGTIHTDRHGVEYLGPYGPAYLYR